MEDVQPPIIVSAAIDANAEPTTELPVLPVQLVTAALHGKAEVKWYTLSEAARAIGHGCKAWQIRRLFQRRRLSEPRRVGRQRVLNEFDLPIVKAALFKYGYLRKVEK